MTRSLSGIAVMVMMVVLAGCGLVDPETAPRPTTEPADTGTASTPVVASPTVRPTPAARTERVALVDYVQGADQPDGAPVLTPSDVDALPGAPEDFRRHLAGLVSRSDVSACPLGIQVERLRTDGWAVGSVRSCEEDQRVLWVREDGRWREAASASRYFACSELEAIGAPSSVAGDECQDGRSVEAYAHEEMTPSASPTAVVDGRYRNARFGYSCEVPEGWTARESDSGADLESTDPSGEVEYYCLGGNTSALADVSTTEAVHEAARVGLEEQGVQISYDAIDGEEFALSGSRDGVVFYLWMVVGEGSTNGVWWSYPEDRADALDQTVAASVRTFRPGDLTAAH